MLKNKATIDRNIGQDEYFVRIIRFPFNFKDNKPEKATIDRLVNKGIFIPAVNKSIKKLDGVSLDRFEYCSLLDSKIKALNSFGISSKGIPEYIGMAIISHKHIVDINNIPIERAIAIPLDEDQEHDIQINSLKQDVAELLEGFDISCLDQYKYFGVIATPVNDSNPSDRLPPPNIVHVDDPGNPAHAEIFYLLSTSEPDNPVDTIIQFISRELLKMASKAIDPNASCTTSIPSITFPS